MTSKGLMLIGAGTSNIDNILIISKTGENKPCISGQVKASSSASSFNNCFIDLENDSDCGHVFLTPFTQFENACIMQINSKKYAYGGYLALEE